MCQVAGTVSGQNLAHRKEHMRKNTCTIASPTADILEHPTAHHIHSNGTTAPSRDHFQHFEHNGVLHHTNFSFSPNATVAHYVQFVQGQTAAISVCILARANDGSWLRAGGCLNPGPAQYGISLVQGQPKTIFHTHKSLRLSGGAHCGYGVVPDLPLSGPQRMTHSDLPELFSEAQ